MIRPGLQHESPYSKEEAFLIRSKLKYVIFVAGKKEKGKLCKKAFQKMAIEAAWLPNHMFSCTKFANRITLILLLLKLRLQKTAL